MHPALGCPRIGSTSLPYFSSTALHFDFNFPFLELSHLRSAFAWSLVDNTLSAESKYTQHGILTFHRCSVGCMIWIERESIGKGFLLWKIDKHQLMLPSRLRLICWAILSRCITCPLSCNYLWQQEWQLLISNLCNLVTHNFYVLTLFQLSKNQSF